MCLVFAALIPVQPLVALEAQGLCPKHMFVVPYLAVRSDVGGLAQQVQHLRGSIVLHDLDTSFSCSMMLL